MSGNKIDVSFTIDDMMKAYRQGVEDCFEALYDFSDTDLDKTLNLASIKPINHDDDNEGV